MRKIVATVLVLALSLVFVSPTEAGCGIRPLRRLGAGLRFVKNHIPLVRRLGR